MRFNTETTGLCPRCGADSPAHYEERPSGMFLHLDCAHHGRYTECVESDARFFRWAYERSYERKADHLALPVTYRCNLRCSYCYTLSNSSLELPRDRPFAELAKIATDFGGNITFIGGEPTLRDDIPELIAAAKDAGRHRKVSVATNGQRLADAEYVGALKRAGTDFVFLSLNDVAYEPSPAVYGRKVQALNNCADLGVPVWLQRTITRLDQLDSLVRVLEAQRKIVFFVTVRAAKAYGIGRPSEDIFVSDILRYLGKQNDYQAGTSPFNRLIKLSGIEVKVCSWVNDNKRVDPVDSLYLISDDTLTTFHRGMRLDEILLLQSALPSPGLVECG